MWRCSGYDRGLGAGAPSEIYPSPTPATPAPVSAPDGGADTLTRRVLEAVEAGNRSEGAIAATLGIGASEASREVERLKGEGLLEVGGNGMLLVAPRSRRLLGLDPAPPGAEAPL